MYVYSCLDMHTHTTQSGISPQEKSSNNMMVSPLLSWLWLIYTPITTLWHVSLQTDVLQFYLSLEKYCMKFSVSFPDLWVPCDYLQLHQGEYLALLIGQPRMLPRFLL